jgi:Aldo/keto reductase family
MAQVALAWLRHRKVPVIPILGARKLTQLQDNLASLDMTLSPDQVKIRDEASRGDLGFPQELYEKEFPRVLRCGGMRDQIDTSVTACKSWAILKWSECVRGCEAADLGSGLRTEMGILRRSP